MTLYNLTSSLPSKASFNAPKNDSDPLPRMGCRQAQALNPIHSAPLTVVRPNPVFFLRKQTALPAEKRDQAQLLNFAKDASLDIKERMPFAELLASGPEKSDFFHSLVHTDAFLQKWKQYAYPKVASFVNLILPVLSSRDQSEGRSLLLAAIAQRATFPNDCRREAVHLMPNGCLRDSLLESLARDTRVLSYHRLEYAQSMPNTPVKESLLVSLVENESFSIDVRILAAKAMQDGSQKDKLLETMVQSVLTFEALKAERSKLKQSSEASGLMFSMDDGAIYFDVYYRRFECIQCLSEQSKRDSMFAAFIQDGQCPSAIKERLQDCKDPKDFLLRLLLNFSVA